MVQYTYDSGGTGTTTIREELAGIISIMSPMDVPLHHMLEQIPVSNTTFEWLVDDIQTPTATRYKLEGATPTGSNTTRFRLRNNVGVDHQLVDVSDTQRVVNEAGIDDEFAYHIVKKGLEVLKQAEFNLHWSKYVSGDSATARETAGLLEWAVLTGEARTAGGSEPVAGVTIPGYLYGANWYAQATTAITEVILNRDIVEPAWRNGMEIGAAVGLCGGKVKRDITAFSTTYNSDTAPGAPSMWINAEKKKKVNSVDLYETDFGPVAIALDRYLDNSAVSQSYTTTVASTGAGAGTLVIANEVFLMVEPQYLQIGVLRPLQYSPLDKDADTSKGYVVVEQGLRVLNPICLSGAHALTA